MNSIRVVDLNKCYSSMSVKTKKLPFMERVKARIEENKKHESTNKKVAYVLKFSGSTTAKEVESLRDEISSIIMSESKPEGVKILIKLDSPGGTVTGYGLVAQQLKRLKERGFDITVVVDQVAASGGYMAAAVSDKIVVAPNAVIGSIGVVCNVPIVEQFLDNIGITYKEYTAGKYKRTVTPYKIPDQESEEHMNDQLQRIHAHFKDHVATYRPDVDISIIGTGEVWSGYEAVENGLADEIGIYDDIVMQWINDYHVLLVQKKQPKKGLMSKFSASIVESLFSKISESTQINNRFK